MSEEAQNQSDSAKTSAIESEETNHLSATPDGLSKGTAIPAENADKNRETAQQSETSEVLNDKGAGQTVSKVIPGRNRTVVILLYVLLLLSASITLLSFASSAIPAPLSAASPIAFVIFFVIFVIYRCVQVYRRRFPMPKAIFQIGIGALFGILLVSAQSTLSSGKADQRPLKPLREMLSHSDPSVRALACDAFVTLSDAEKESARSALEALKNDRHAAVRERAEKALSASEKAP